MAGDFLSRAEAESILSRQPDKDTDTEVDEYGDPFVPFTEAERIKLSKFGVDPRFVISHRMLAAYWGMSDNSLRVHRHRKTDEDSLIPVMVGNSSYFKRSDLVLDWKPPEPKPKPQSLVPMIREIRETPQVTALTVEGRRLRKLAYTQALIDTVTIDDWVQIVSKAVEEAKLGDQKSRQWLSGYLIGTPIQRAEIDLEINRDRFSEAQRKEALMQLLGGDINGIGVIDVVGELADDDPDSEEVDG